LAPERPDERDLFARDPPDERDRLAREPPEDRDLLACDLPDERDRLACEPPERDLRLPACEPFEGGLLATEPGAPPASTATLTLDEPIVAATDIGADARSSAPTTPIESRSRPLRERIARVVAVAETAVSLVVMDSPSLTPLGAAGFNRVGSNDPACVRRRDQAPTHIYYKPREHRNVPVIKMHCKESRKHRIIQSHD